MIIGHLASGYVYSKLLSSRLASHGFATKSVMIAGIVGAIAPDFDMLYFYLVDNRQHHHHSYWSHFPIVWFTGFF